MENELLVGKEGVIQNYRLGTRNQKGNCLLVKIEGVDSNKEASRLIGRVVEWINPKSGKTIRGKIVRTHGNKGVVRTRFKKGLPGQALGTKIKIVK